MAVAPPPVRDREGGWYRSHALRSDHARDPNSRPPQARARSTNRGRRRREPSCCVRRFVRRAFRSEGRGARPGPAARRRRSPFARPSRLLRGRTTEPRASSSAPRPTRSPRPGRALESSGSEGLRTRIFPNVRIASGCAANAPAAPTSGGGMPPRRQSRLPEGVIARNERVGQDARDGWRRARLEHLEVGAAQSMHVESPGRSAPRVGPAREPRSRGHLLQPPSRGGTVARAGSAP